MYLTIIDGTLQAHDGVLRNVEDIYQIVGGHFDHSSLRLGNRILTVYCHEHSLYDMPPNVFIPQMGQIFHGPIVIDVADPVTGETVSMSPDETSRIRLVKTNETPIPTLYFQ